MSEAPTGFASFAGQTKKRYPFRLDSVPCNQLKKCDEIAGKFAKLHD